MKEVVIYNTPKDKVFLLTDQEFFEAAQNWAEGNDYYCARLEALIPPRHKWAETPSEDIGFEVLLEITKTGGTQKYFKKDSKFYQSFITENGDERKIEVRMTEDIKKRLIDQDSFYRDKKYLK